MDFLKRVLGTKTFWTGLGSLVGGCIFLAQGKVEVGAVMVTQGVGMIVGRDALAKVAGAIKDNSKALILTVALGASTLSGCATFKAVTSGAGELAKDTGKAIVEDVDWRRHIADFLEGLGDMIFGEEEDATEEPETDHSESEDVVVASSQGSS